MKTKMAVVVVLIAATPHALSECKIWESPPTENEVAEFVVREKAKASEIFNTEVSGEARLSENKKGSSLSQSVQKVEDGVAPGFSVSKEKVSGGTKVCVTPSS